MKLSGIPDSALRRIAARVRAGEESEDPRIRQEIIEFLRENPNPEDELLHDWAEERGYDIHEIEDQMYELATEHIKE